MEQSRIPSRPSKDNTTAKTEAAAGLEQTEERPREGSLPGMLSVNFLQQTIGNQAVSRMVQRQTEAKPRLQTKRAPIPGSAAGVIQMRKVPVQVESGAPPVVFETRDFTEDFLQRVKVMLDFYDEKAALELQEALDNDEYMVGMNEEDDDGEGDDGDDGDDGEYFPLQEQLDHFEEVVLPNIEQAQARIKEKKGPQALTKFQGDVFEGTTMYDAEQEETKAVSTNEHQSNFSGIDFMMEMPGGPFGQDKSHISGGMEQMVAAYVGEYLNRYVNAKKMLSKMINPKTKTAQNMLAGLQAAFGFEGGLAETVAARLESIHEHNVKALDDDSGSDLITEPDEDLIELVGDNMLFTCPEDVFMHLPEDMQHQFIAASVTSGQLKRINERSLALGLTKPPKPRGSKDADPDYDGT